MNKKLVILALVVLSVFVLSACSRTAAPNYAEIPAGKAFADGKTIFFSHTEVSDPQVGELLTKMMKSPVLVVPSLAETPAAARSHVYVFQNGVAGSGPFKFQADVFPNQPGDPDYSPLRQVVLVKWSNESQAKELTSEDEILALVDQGALSVEETNIVVNMPFMTWNGGQR